MRIGNSCRSPCQTNSTTRPSTMAISVINTSRLRRLNCHSRMSDISHLRLSDIKLPATPARPPAMINTTTVQNEIPLGALGEVNAPPEIAQTPKAKLRPMPMPKPTSILLIDGYSAMCLQKAALRIARIPPNTAANIGKYPSPPSQKIGPTFWTTNCTTI
jgi:hypothetical protein